MPTRFLNSGTAIRIVLLTVFAFASGISQAELIDFASCADPEGAAIQAADCHAFDNRAYFGPVRDQGEGDLCWSFAATALLEEEACREDPSTCGQALSVLDAARCVRAERAGGDPYFALQCALNSGVCQENDAPYTASFGLLRMMPISRVCEKNRYQFSNRMLQPASVNFADNEQKLFTTISRKWSELNRLAQSGRSFGVDFCTREEASSRGKNDGDESCGAHSVVVNAMKFENCECKMHIRNSWGDRPEFSGWTSSTSMIQRIYRLNYLRQAKPHPILSGRGRAGSSFRGRH